MRFFPRPDGEHITAVSKALGYSKFSFVVDTMGVLLIDEDINGRERAVGISSSTELLLSPTSVAAAAVGCCDEADASVVMLASSMSSSVTILSVSSSSNRTWHSS